MTRAIDRLIVSGSIDPRAQGRRDDADRLGARTGSTAREELGCGDAAPVELEREGARVLVRRRPRRAERRPSGRARGGGARRRARPARAVLAGRRAAAAAARAGARADRGAAAAAAARRQAALLQRARALRALLVPLLRRARRRDAPGRAQRRACPADAGSRRPRSATPCTGCSSSSTSRAPEPPDVEHVRSWYPRRDATRSSSGSKASSVPTASPSSHGGSPRLAGARPERPFAFEHDGVLLHGRLDVLQREGTRALVLDYKTNSLAEGTPEEIVEADYRLQRLVYALACFRAGAEEVEVVYHFLERADAVVARTFVRRELPELEAELSEAIARDPRRRVPADAERVHLRRLSGARRRLRRPAPAGARRSRAARRGPASSDARRGAPRRPRQPARARGGARRGRVARRRTRSCAAATSSPARFRASASTLLRSARGALPPRQRRSRLVAATGRGRRSWVVEQLGPDARLPRGAAATSVTSTGSAASSSATDRRAATRRSSPGSRRTSELAAALADVEEAVVVGGHTHVQFDRECRAIRGCVNAGSVGMPYEGRRGAFWALARTGRRAPPD